MMGLGQETVGPGTASSSQAGVTIGRVVCGLRFNAKAVRTDVYSDFRTIRLRARPKSGRLTYSGSISRPF